MCKPQSEGGQRCAAHTRPAYSSAKPGTAAWDDAAAQHASTPTGAKEIKAEALAADERGDYEHHAACNAALQRGASLRAQTGEVRATLRGKAGSGQQGDLPDLTGPDVVGADLRGRDLTGRQVDGYWLAEAKFKGARVSYTAPRGNTETATLTDVEKSDWPIQGQVTYSVVFENGLEGSIDASKIGTGRNTRLVRRGGAFAIADSRFTSL